MFTKSVLCGTVFGLLAATAFAQTTSVGLWSYFVGPAFTDADGTALVGSDPVTDPGQGDMIVLGFFDGIDGTVDVSTFGAAQWDSFTPIIGPESANPHILSQIGPIEGEVGYFSVGITLDPTAGDVLPSGYSTYRAGVRFYDSNTLGSSENYNTVTSNDSNWFIPAAGTPPATPPVMNFENPAILEFEGTAYMTDIPLVPEPSAALLVLSATGLLLRRSRHS